MAGTRRHTVARLRRCGFSDEVLATYAEMRDLPCACEKSTKENSLEGTFFNPSSPTGIRNTECKNCQTWWQLHSQLWRLLSPHRPWHYPAVPRHVGGAAMDGGALADALEEALGSRDSETVKAPGRPPSGGARWQPDDDEP